MDLDRNGMMVLSRGQCLRLLRRTRVGRVVVTIDGVPAAFPVNFALLDDDIVFRTGPGTKLSAALDGATVGFEVDRIDPVFESGWSVLIQGPSAVMTDDDELLKARRLHLRTWAPGQRPHFVRIRSESVSGRRFLSPAHALAETWDDEEEQGRSSPIAGGGRA